MSTNLEAAEPGRSRGPRRIVLTAFGSLGDLHPYIGIALGLQQRGHDVVLAASECYREKIGALGIGFRVIRPNSDWVSDPVAMRRYLDYRHGTVRVVREKVLPVLRESYDDITAAADEADVLVSHPLMAYATRLVAEKTGIPWASTMITPLGFFSADDPPVMPIIPKLSRWLRFLGPAFWRPVFWLSKRVSRYLAKPWYRLRAEIGLPPTREGNPLTDSNSPELGLALFSKVFAAEMPDWPRRTVITGFPEYDRDGEAGLPADVAQFLEAGPAPIVFTLGMSAAMVAGDFYEQSVAAVVRLGVRALLITGKNSRNLPPSLPPGVMACSYAPFSLLFPRAAAIVHHGGIGTTGLAMRAGRPMLVVPFSHDNPDNAARVVRLGIGRSISNSRCSAERLASELRRLLDEPAYARRADVLGRQVREENGVQSVCEALEAFMAKRRG